MSAIRRSLELAEAMESRAWGASEKRTNLYVLKLRRHDIALIAIAVGMLIFAVYVLWARIEIPLLTKLILP